nr:unnamed protein product [Naegleria fowleri]
MKSSVLKSSLLASFLIVASMLSMVIKAELYTTGDKKDATETKDTNTVWPVTNTWWATPNAFFMNPVPFGANFPANFWKTNVWNGNNGVFWNAQLNPFNNELFTNNALFLQNGPNQATMFPGLQNGNLFFGAFGNNGFTFPAAWNAALFGANNVFPGVPPFGATVLQAKNAVHYPVTEGYDIEYNFPGGRAKQFFAKSKIESQVY